MTKRAAQCHHVPLCCSKSSTQAQVPITLLCTTAPVTSQYPCLRKPPTRGRLEVTAGDSCPSVSPLLSFPQESSERKERLPSLHALLAPCSKEQTRQGTVSSAAPSREQVCKLSSSVFEAKELAAFYCNNFQVQQF